jgi:microcystin-dependent protein
MADSFVGQIVLFGCNFAPNGYAFCQGQVLPIAQNTALFSLLGTTYGGNGQSTFALPDLRGRASLGFGQGPGLTDRTQGEVGGTEAVTLAVQQIPQHAHALTNTLTATARCRNAPGNQQTPAGHVPAIEASNVTATYSSALPDANQHGGAVVLTGGVTSPAGVSQPHDNRQPYLALNYCIALQGVFPARQ